MRLLPGFKREHQPERVHWPCWPRFIDALPGCCRGAEPRPRVRQGRRERLQPRSPCIGWARGAASRMFCCIPCREIAPACTVPIPRFSRWVGERQPSNRGHMCAGQELSSCHPAPAPACSALFPRVCRCRRSHFTACAVALDPSGGAPSPSAPTTHPHTTHAH